VCVCVSFSESISSQLDRYLIEYRTKSII